MERILHVNIDNNGGNGAFSLVRYLYYYLKDEYIFDYYTMGNFIEDSEYEAIVKEGGRCYSAMLRKNRLLGHFLLPFKFSRFLKDNDYNTVHIHSEVAYKVFLYVLGARLAHIDKIIVHAHSSDIDGDYVYIKRLAHKICKKFICRYATDFISISEKAAEWLFTFKVVAQKRVRYLQNGITPNLYKYSLEERKRVRKELSVDDDALVMGHVGALKKVKNQEFLVEVLSYILKKRKDAYLVLIGSGDDKDEIEKKVNEMNLQGNVLMLGARNDVARVLQAFDVFVFPSLFEGVPMALIEAQCVGLPIVASDCIDAGIKINENVDFMPLEAGAEAWAERISDGSLNNMKLDGYINVSNSKFNIKNSADVLRKIYARM